MYHRRPLWWSLTPIYQVPGTVPGTGMSYCKDYSQGRSLIGIDRAHHSPLFFEFKHMALLFLEQFVWFAISEVKFLGAKNKRDSDRHFGISLNK